MKLQPAMIFGEHMVLQRNFDIPIWGRSVRNDEITVTLCGETLKAVAEEGVWRVKFPPMEAIKQTVLEIHSSRTGESVVFSDVAIGEVWLAGGQSNMEFLLKYDENAEEMYEEPADPFLRYFRYPLVNFPGCLEKDVYPDDGFWRSWTDVENKGMFSGPAAYMGRVLRKTLGVPVGFIGCNWGGTPAAAWTDMTSLKENSALKPILDWQENAVKHMDLQKYYSASDLPVSSPTEEEQERMEKFMMGIGLEEFFQSMGDMPPPQPSDYSPFIPGPRAAVRPAGLYENILRHIAPYAVRGAIWYQGEDDDSRDWADIYAQSMKTLITSWRKLWDRDFPFLQVELAPFEGVGFTAAKNYPKIRRGMREVAAELDNIHDVCIMDAGDRINIHVRKKKPVGERLALLARKYVYGESDLLADSPSIEDSEREEDMIKLHFSNTGDGLHLEGQLDAVLKVTIDGKPISVCSSIKGNTLILKSPEFRHSRLVKVEFCELNYCVDPLFNSAGLPTFPFTLEV